MKYVILGLVFIAVPFLLLSQFVLPALESLEQVYANSATLAEQAAGTKTQIPKPTE
jgi:hypothetical protein